MPSGGNRAEMEGFVRETLGTDLQVAVLEAVFSVYRRAAGEIATLSPPQAKKSFVTQRLVYLEEALRIIGNRFPHMATEDARTERGAYEYVRLVGDGIVITAASVPDQSSLPRPSRFRNTLAKGVIYSLFETEDEPSEPGFWHVLLLHGTRLRLESGREGVVRKRRVYTEPAFVNLVVPTRDALDREGDIRLFTDFPEVVAGLRGVIPTDTPTTKLERDLRLRRDRKADDGTENK